MRVVAQVERTLTFDAQGKPTVTNLDGAWVVRSNSYQMSVAPVTENAEMIVIRPEHPVVFAAGRSLVSRASPTISPWTARWAIRPTASNAPTL